MKMFGYNLLTTTALLLISQVGSPDGSSAIAAGQTALLSGEVPEGLSADDWTGIHAAYEAARHAVRSVEGGHQAWNPGQGWRTHFDSRGFLTEPDVGDWKWGLELESYGFAGGERAVTGPERVHAEAGRVSYDWDETIQEWFINDARGLEHGFTLHRRPEGHESFEASYLTLTLAVRGGLHPELTRSGRDVRFLNVDGELVLNYAGLTVFDADGQQLQASFKCVGDRLRLIVDEKDARYPLTIDPIAQQAYLKASNTDAEDHFGRSVAIWGDTVVIGAPLEDSNATSINGDQGNSGQDFNAGAAYVFVRGGDGWIQQAYLKASNAEAGDVFGASVAMSENTAVVGATGKDDCDGAVYIFVRNGVIWSQQAYLKASNDGNEWDEFGDSVAISGDTVVVGAPAEQSNATGVNGDESDDSAQDSGAVYVFVRNGMSWSQQAYLKASNTDEYDGFGWSVSVSGDTIVVGSPNEDSDATGVNGDQGNPPTIPEGTNNFLNAGAAYVFVRSNGEWSQQAYLKASNSGRFDEFGRSVAVSGDTVVVGAPREGSDATGVNGSEGDWNTLWEAGAAYVFVRNNGQWIQQAYLKASNTGHGDGDNFGRSVAVSGDTVVIGAPLEDSDATGVDGSQGDVDDYFDAGAAYVFVRAAETWSQQAFLKASNTDVDDRFGFALAISGDTVVVGAAWEDGSATAVNGGQGNGAPSAGAAYVFTLQTDTDALSISLDHTPAGEVGHSYYVDLGLTGGTGPYLAKVSAGKLPAGLALSDAGLLGGTLYEKGINKFTVTVTDANQQSASKAFVITVKKAVQWTTMSLGKGKHGKEYQKKLKAKHGSGPFTYSISGGALPNGVQLDSAKGRLQGVPTEVGTFFVTLEVADALGATKDRHFVLTVKGTLKVVTNNLAEGKAGKQYLKTVKAKGGVAGATGYGFSVVNGSLPNGISLASDGLLFGVPTQKGTAKFTIRATDGSGVYVDKKLKIKVK